MPERAMWAMKVSARLFSKKQIALIFLILVLLGFLVNTEEVPDAALPCRDCKVAMAY